MCEQESSFVFVCMYNVSVLVCVISYKQNSYFLFVFFCVKSLVFVFCILGRCWVLCFVCLLLLLFLKICSEEMKIQMPRFWRKFRVAN
jgi:hypothetical protein